MDASLPNTLQHKVLAAVSAMCRDSFEAQRTLLQQGGLPVVMTAIAPSRADDRVQQKGLFFLGSLCRSHKQWPDAIGMCRLTGGGPAALQAVLTIATEAPNVETQAKALDLLSLVLHTQQQDSAAVLHEGNRAALQELGATDQMQQVQAELKQKADTLEKGSDEWKEMVGYATTAARIAKATTSASH